jgi:hypothetical protein
MVHHESLFYKSFPPFYRRLSGELMGSVAEFKLNFKNLSTEPFLA